MSISSVLLYEYVHLMKKKSEALDKLKEFKAKLEKQLGRHIKSLCFDRGGEYMSIEVVFFSSRSIESYLSIVLQELYNKMKWQKKEIKLY